MSRIIATFLCLCLSFLTFSQAKKQIKWERVIAEMTKANEGDTITYRFKSSLDWSDFEMSSELNNNQKAHIDLTFGVFTKKVNVWTGVITVESSGGIRRDLSWVNSQYKSQQLLDYLQLKYEITHSFAKKLENEINTSKLNAGNTKKINGIIENMYIRNYSYFCIFV